MSTSIRIAISGGGLAGASLLHALLPHQHLDVHIFESASAFKEAGLAIGFARNALDALDLIGPSATACLSRAGAVPLRGVRFMLAQGDGSGSDTVVDENKDGERIASIVHRAAFLKELLAEVPAERMHASKKLDHFDRNGDGSLKLHFTDGTTHECDILIGADGIHSTVRKLILNDPAAFARNTGAWCVMALKPYAEAQASLGNEFINVDDPCEYTWIGKGSFLLHNLLSEGQLVQFIIASHEKDFVELADSWHKTVTAAEIMELYQDWPPHLVKAVKEVRLYFSCLY